MNILKEKEILGAIAVIVLLILLPRDVNGQEVTFYNEPKLNEDQIITCVTDVSDTANRGHLTCHIFDIDDLDWYQEISEPNYGNIGSINDSFEMVIIP